MEFVTIEIVKIFFTISALDSQFFHGLIIWHFKMICDSTKNKSACCRMDSKTFFFILNIKTHKMLQFNNKLYYKIRVIHEIKWSNSNKRRNTAPHKPERNTLIINRTTTELRTTNNLKRAPTTDISTNRLLCFNKGVTRAGMIAVGRLLLCQRLCSCSISSIA